MRLKDRVEHPRRDRSELGSRRSNGNLAREQHCSDVREEGMWSRGDVREVAMRLALVPVTGIHVRCDGSESKVKKAWVVSESSLYASTCLGHLLEPRRRYMRTLQACAE